MPYVADFRTAPTNEEDTTRPDMVEMTTLLDCLEYQRTKSMNTIIPTDG